MAKPLTVDGVLNLMRHRQGNRTAKAFAAELGITAAYLSDVYQGKRDPGAKILEQLGLERRVVYINVA